MNHTAEPWEDVRGFRDEGNVPGDHFTVDDDFITVYMGEEAVNNFDPEKHDWAEIHGPNQEANAHFIAVSPGLLGILERIKAECFVRRLSAKTNVHNILELTGRASLRKSLELINTEHDVVDEVAPEGEKAQMSRLALLDALAPFTHFGTFWPERDHPCERDTARIARKLHRLILDECSLWECAQGY